tara:strand:- start:181 stop:1440 length:1260 start_codon:yes stop_codon:yes gene_type:complete
MYYLYLIIICVIIFIVFNCYIKIRYKFWSRQPVFHYYNLLFWLFPRGIIDKNLPISNKYCDFINIETKNFIACDNNLLNEIVTFIKTYYVTHCSCNYEPSLSNFSSYFTGSNHKTFISIYYKPTVILNSDNSFINDKQIIGIMTTRPINITITKCDTFLAYYVDNLCIHNSYRKQNIAPKLIQTTHYTQRHKNKDSHVSLFKREGEITGIVPLTKYNTYQFNLSSIDKPNTINCGTHIIEITKLNMSLLIDFIYSKKHLFDCIVLPDINQIINLVSNNTYIIYGIIENNDFKAVYFFKDSQMIYNLEGKRENIINNHNIKKTINKRNINKKLKSIDFFASINLFNDDKLFINCFNLVLSKCNKNKTFTLITIENISCNYIIINNLFMLNKNPIIVSPTAYFYYNYARKKILPEKALIIC